MASKTFQPRTGPNADPVASFIHPQALMSIRNLELRAKVVVEGFWAGLHRSPFHGFSVEFTEYRQYSSGDDPRYLDWKLFARSDRYYIKKYEDETNLRCHLLVDNSRSMHFGTQSYNKAQYANTLAATLAYFLYLQGDAVGLMTFDERVREYLPARHRGGHLRHLMLALEKPGAGTATDLASPLRRIVEVTRKRGLMILITDLLTPIDALEDSLALLAASGHEVVLFQVLDPAELNFTFDQAAVYEDLESGRTLYVDPHLARREYGHKLASHLEAAALICRKLDVVFRRLTSDTPLELALFDFMRSRIQQNKRVRRAGMIRRNR